MTRFHHIEGLDVNLPVDLGRCLVTGSSGFLGTHIAQALVARGVPVRGIDLATTDALPDAVEQRSVDLRDPVAVRDACEGIDTVFHTASFVEPLTFARANVRARTFSINVDGTRHLLAGCRAHGVSRLVYTSSNSVVFDRPLAGADESTPYVARAVDIYTDSKTLAEKAVRAADGVRSTGPNPVPLHTCALRPGGIYGPGERHHLPRLVKEVMAGRFVSVIGGMGTMSDTIFVDNLVDAHIAAAEHLAPGSAACGQAYFVSDGIPVNYWAFFRPFIEAVGYRVPKASVPTPLVFAFATLAELLHLAGGPRPFMMRTECRTAAVTHWFRIERAARDFRWRPRISPEEAARRTIPYVQDLVRGELPLPMHR